MRAQLVLDCRNSHGEGILWDGVSSRLWWTDIEGHSLWWYEPSGGDSGTIVMPERLCAFAPRDRGGWIMGFASGVELWSPEMVRELRVLDFEPHDDETRLNDGRTDREGCFVVGGMNEKSGMPSSRVIRINADLSVEQLIENVSCANSTCFSPDGKAMYFTDTPERTIRRYAYGDTIELDAVWDISAEAGMPDGSCVDADGGVWNAAWEGGQVVRLDQSGRVTHRIVIPVPKATCCTFGGADLETLFITTSRLGSTVEDIEQYPSSGSLFAFKPGFKGMNDRAFAG